MADSTTAALDTADSTGTDKPAAAFRLISDQEIPTTSQSKNQAILGAIPQARHTWSIRITHAPRGNDRSHRTADWQCGYAPGDPHDGRRAHCSRAARGLGIIVYSCIGAGITAGVAGWAADAGILNAVPGCR